ncbi:MAG: hypothetical protein M3Q07_28880, partial [Pseudobdellovibrionaceae bacterium]|nr:hypothetical protein [Pseudobdellovibrionaceae bacterium]
MSKRILLTGSRAPATLELTRILAKAGFEVYNADSTGSSLAGSSRSSKRRFKLDSPRFDLQRYCHQLTEVIQTCDIDVLWPTCEEIFYIAAIKSELEDHCHVLAPPLDLILSVHDKYRFSILAQQNGMRTPASYLSQKGDPEKRLKAAGSWLNENSPEPTGALVLKPSYSRFASKVVISSRAQLGKDLARFDLNQGIVLQEFIAGPLI